MSLKERFDAARENWWAERGSIRFLNSDSSLASAVAYVLEAQDRKNQVTRSVTQVTRSVSEGERFPGL